MKSQTMRLVRMEILSSKKHLVMIILVPLLYPVVLPFKGFTAVAYIFSTAMVGYLLFTGFAECDEKFKTGIMLNTLPVKRNEIILARFVSLYIIYALATVLVILSAFALHIFMPQNYDAFDFNAIPIGLVVVSIMNAFQIPLYYLFDVQKSRIISLFLMFGPLFLTSFFTSKGWFTSALRYFTSLNDFFRNCVFLLTAAIVFVISLTITEKIYLRKEF